MHTHSVPAQGVRRCKKHFVLQYHPWLDPLHRWANAGSLSQVFQNYKFKVPLKVSSNIELQHLHNIYFSQKHKGPNVFLHSHTSKPLF